MARSLLDDGLVSGIRWLDGGLVSGTRWPDDGSFMALFLARDVLMLALDAPILAR